MFNATNIAPRILLRQSFCNSCHDTVFSCRKKMSKVPIIRAKEIGLYDCPVSVCEIEMILLQYGQQMLESNTAAKLNARETLFAP